MRLDGKVALITGAGGGIGSAAAQLFASEGATVWLGDVADGAVAAIRERSPEADLRDLHLDVTQPESVADAMARIRRECGRLDILYNNAGGTQPGDTILTDCDDQVFWNTIGVDLFGVWLCCKHGVQLMEEGGGAIVNTASIVAITGFARNPAYSAAKGGVAALTRSLAVAFAPIGVRVNAIAPGITRSPRVERSVAAGRVSRAIQDRHLSGFLECEQIARKALFLASDDAAGMTGQILVADAGATIA